MNFCFVLYIVYYHNYIQLSRSYNINQYVYFKRVEHAMLTGYSAIYIDVLLLLLSSFMTET